MQRDFAPEAEELFRSFATRHSLVIEKLDEPNVELLMRISAQRGLDFELTLGLQNTDELNIGFEKFWSYFFPFEKQRHNVEQALDGLMSGDTRLATHRQFGWVVKRVLEVCNGGTWKPIYHAYSVVQVPFIGTSISYLKNGNHGVPSPG